MGSAMIGMDPKTGLPVYFEVHHSGVLPSTWVCGHCGKSLKDEEHVQGLRHPDIRYCKKCANRGKIAKDLPTLNDAWEK